MVDLLDKIEDIKRVPAIVDGYMATKHHVHAAEKLVSTIELLEGKSLGTVRALHDLHRGLVTLSPVDSLSTQAHSCGTVRQPRELQQPGCDFLLVMLPCILPTYASSA
jgi:hypothetical protein